LNRSVWRLVIVGIAAALVGALIMYAIVRPAPKEEAADEKPATQRVAIENGEPTITLDADTQQKIALATSKIAPSQQTEELQLFGTVVDVQELASAANQIAAARSQYDQAMAKGTYDRAELSRLKTLNADNKNVSDRAVQEAAAAVAADDAAVKSAASALDAAINAARQRFGTVVGTDLQSNSGLGSNLLSLRETLVQIAMPVGTAPPKSIQVVASDGSKVTASFVGIAPRVDPRLQGASYLYLAPGGKLAAGMNVTARFAGSQSVGGAVVPGDAVVSFQGKSWLYIKRDATHFVRREISIATPVSAGFFVTNVPAGSDIVTGGAQQLLSEEMRSQLHEE
jgi:hypothetical protein